MISKEFTFTCELINGLHARPASLLVKEIQIFNIDVSLNNRRNKRTANARSALSLIATDVAFHDICTLRITGEDAEKAFSRLRHFILKEWPKNDERPSSSKAPGSLPPSLRVVEMNHAKGLATGDGWARGVPVHLKEYRFLPGPDHAVYAGVTGERLRLVGALEQLQNNLKEAIDKAELVAERAVLNAHYTLACDPDFRKRLLNHVNNGLSVVESIEATLEHFSYALRSSESTYLHDRVIDIRDLCDQILHLSYGSGCLYSPDTLSQHSICLADNLTPSQFLALDHRYLNGLVLESGGKASHTVLIAQARGVPVVVGVEGARELISHAKEVILDAGLGILITDPPKEVNRYYQQEHRKQQKLSERYLPFIVKKAQTRDGKMLEVSANIVGIEDAENAFMNGAEGIGLFRSEMIYMQREQAPDEQEQIATYTRVLQLAKGKPVIIRTIDVGADKPLDYLDLMEEQNPFLGYRAVRLYPEFIELFRTQVRSILKAAKNGTTSLMIPMISCLDEVLWIRNMIDEICSVMDINNETYGNIKLGIMLEVPSACLIIDQLAAHVDFFSIGSNDLAQYFLAADRDNERVSELYNYLHPSFLRLLNTITTETKKYQCWTGLCGEMATNHEVLPILVGLGLDEVSMPNTFIPAIKERLSHLDSEECYRILEQAMSCNSIQAVQTLLRTCQHSIASRPVFASAIVNVDYEALTKEEAVKELVDMMLLDGRLSDTQSVEEAVWSREAIYSTSMGNGIAIPHVQSETISCHSVGVLNLRKPVRWHITDNELITTIFLLAVPDAGAKDQHMKVFARLARKLVRAEFLQRFNQCTTDAEVVELLQVEMSD